MSSTSTTKDDKGDMKNSHPVVVVWSLCLSIMSSSSSSSGGGGGGDTAAVSTNPKASGGRGRRTKKATTQPAATVVAPRRVVITVKPEWTVDALFDKAQQELVCSDSNGNNNNSSSSSNNNSHNKKDVKLQMGFPPKPLHRSSTTTLIQAGIQNHEKITVQWVESGTNSAHSSSSTKTLGQGRSTTSEKQRTDDAKFSATGANQNTSSKKRKRTNHKTTSTASESDDNSNNNSDNDNTPTTTIDRRSPSRRAAAQKATESFAEVIRAQEELQLQQQQSKQQKERKSIPRSPKQQSPQKSPSTSRPVPNKRFAAAATTGRRLQDGAVIQKAPPRPRQRRNQQQPPPFHAAPNQNDDPSLALLGTLESNTSHGRLMRQGWKQAVQDRYEQNKAAARLAALSLLFVQQPPNAGGTTAPVQFVVTPPLPGKNNNNNNDKDDNDDDDDDDDEENDDDKTQQLQPRTLRITYPKGVQGRGHYEESVDYLPRSVLQQVIASIHPTNPETLRPSNLALLSPRVFWSLAFHYSCRCCRRRDCGKNTQDISSRASSSSTMEAALRSIQPNLDWSFLRRRKQELSAKARENLRQEQEQRQQQEQQPDWEAAAAAILSVEQAMNQVQALDRQHRNQRMLQAVANRNRPVLLDMDDDDEWQLTTPTEVDEDELLTCIQVHPVPSSSSSLLSLDSSDLVHKLIHHCRIRNWRELANVESATALAAQILQEEDNATAANPDAPTTSRDHPTTEKKKTKYQEDDRDTAMAVLADCVESWIDRAQQESVEEIIVQVCDDNIPAVTLLCDKAQSGTPQDLAHWRFIVPELHALLVEQEQQQEQQCAKNNNNIDKADANHHHHHNKKRFGEEENQSNDNDDVETAPIPSLADLQKWCHQAQLALEQYPWLKQIVTPIIVGTGGDDEVTDG
ncbi:hypothetical protein ACA910_019085 [Epithemia clementina (nom. ined.)]